MSQLIRREGVGLTLAQVLHQEGALGVPVAMVEALRVELHPACGLLPPHGVGPTLAVQAHLGPANPLPRSQRRNERPLDAESVQVAGPQLLLAPPALLHPQDDGVAPDIEGQPQMSGASGRHCSGPVAPAAAAGVVVTGHQTVPLRCPFGAPDHQPGPGPVHGELGEERLRRGSAQRGWLQVPGGLLGAVAAGVDLVGARLTQAPHRLDVPLRIHGRVQAGNLPRRVLQVHGIGHPGVLRPQHVSCADPRPGTLLLVPDDRQLAAAVHGDLRGQGLRTGAVEAAGHEIPATPVRVVAADVDALALLAPVMPGRQRVPLVIQGDLGPTHLPPVQHTRGGPRRLHRVGSRLGQPPSEQGLERHGEPPSRSRPEGMNRDAILRLTK